MSNDGIPVRIAGGDIQRMSVLREGQGKSGRVASLQRSGGGVPKLPVERAKVELTGMVGDWQRDRRHHGGPDRALCLYSVELLDALRAEGHPVSAGSMGENVTMSGIDWRSLVPGVRLRIGTVDVEITDYAAPCTTIRNSFKDNEFTRASQKRHPGWSRVYVRILREGEIAPGDEVSFL
jgi:MOSC domain-containing protein YiiM